MGCETPERDGQNESQAHVRLRGQRDAVLPIMARFSGLRNPELIPAHVDEENGANLLATRFPLACPARVNATIERLLEF